MPEIRTMDRMCGSQDNQRPQPAPQEKVYTQDTASASPEQKHKRRFKNPFKRKSKKRGVTA